MKKIIFLAVFILSISATAQTLSRELTIALKNDDTKAINRLVTAANKDTCYTFPATNLTVLQLAISMQSGDVVNHLISKSKSDVNASCNGETPLMVAARQNNTNIVKYLLDAGANRDAVFNGKTALEIAKEFKNDSIAALLAK